MKKWVIGVVILLLLVLTVGVFLYINYRLKRVDVVIDGELTANVGKEIPKIINILSEPVITRTVNTTTVANPVQTPVVVLANIPPPLNELSVITTTPTTLTNNNTITASNTGAGTGRVQAAIINAEANPTTAIVSNYTGGQVLTGSAVSSATSTMPVEQIPTTIAMSNSASIIYTNTAKSVIPTLHYYGNSGETQCNISTTPFIRGGYMLKFTCLLTEVLTSAALTIYVYTRGGVSFCSLTPVVPEPERSVVLMLKFSLIPTEGLTTGNVKSEFRGKVHAVMMGIDESGKLCITYNTNELGYYPVALGGFTSAMYEKLSSCLIVKEPVLMQTMPTVSVIPATGLLYVPSTSSIYHRGRACVLHMIKASDKFPGHVYFTTDPAGKQPLKSFLYFPEPPDFMYTQKCEIATATYNGLSYEVIRAAPYVFVDAGVSYNRDGDTRTPEQKAFFTIYLPYVSQLRYAVV